ncbi:MAG: hydroxyacid dehydrogenase [Spirochaetales bacterium]|jgi:D-3-phosphoglycerate dehydrogenase|nr:hydroxyacid dehydrogenase [Spirochaetales bacterium]
MKFVMTQAVCGEALALLEGKAAVFVADNGDPAAYPDEMRDADAIIVRIGRMDKAAIEQSPRLKVIGRPGVGYDSVDIQAATAAGVPVVITPGANTRSVAEHAIAMMLALSKNLVEGHNETQKGNFSAVREAGKSFEVLGKTAGFIGLGAIGAEAARLSGALGMRTLGYDPFLPREKIEALGCAYYEKYEDMLKDCDFVSVHVPLTEATRNMIAKKHFVVMKKTALIINCARGGIINEADLIEALEKGIIAGAGMDVFAAEPPLPDDPLLSAKNILYSPHSAAQTREAVINMHRMCVEGCLAVLRGEKWPHVVNKEAYEHSRWNNT